MNLKKPGGIHKQAKKSLGQNFLVDKNYQLKIIESVKKNSSSGSILEIGPGQGALSQHLIPLAQVYAAVEKDRDFAADLTKVLKEPHFVISGDFLKIDLSFLEQTSKWVAVGNLPYNVASQIFIRLIENRSCFTHLLLMFQKEMALRFVAKPGTKDYGLLTLWATLYTESEILFHLPATVFRPQPKITSSFVQFTIKESPLISDKEATTFWPFVRNLFQHRRKTLGAILKEKKYLLAADQIKARAEDMSVIELIGLYRKLS